MPEEYPINILYSNISHNIPCITGKIEAGIYCVNEPKEFKKLLKKMFKEEINTPPIDFKNCMVLCIIGEKSKRSGEIFDIQHVWEYEDRLEINILKAHAAGNCAVLKINNQPYQLITFVKSPKPIVLVSPFITMALCNCSLL